MSSIARSRPTRRSAAARRSYAIEETSEEEDPGNVTPTASQHGEDDDDSGEATPVPKKPRIEKRSSRRRATVEQTTPKATRTTRRSRRSATAELSEASQLTDTNDNEGDSVASVEEPETASQVTASVNKITKPSVSPSPSQPRSQRGSVPPLADITESAVNQTPAKSESEEKPQIAMINPNTTVLEKPMDIMMKSRLLGPSAPEEPSEPKSRLIITTLILMNFKSYAGKQIVGPFHASFSSVVGPNGSGKSNVIDALLFVFGFRASKMRQGKVSALIHNSANFPNLPYCEVEVHFQEVLDLPTGGHEVVPDSQLIISRKAFKNNSSKYYMNGKETNFTAVTTLLRDRGIDLDHKRFLILQGEVESIAQMKAKAANEHEDGLLEYLEDIIGTSKYKTPIDEAAAELETLNDVCMEKNNRVQHVEKEKNALEDKKDKALAFIRDENELAQKQSALYQIYINECGDNIRVTEEAILQMQELLNLELEKHEGNESGIKELEKAYKRGMREYESMEKEMQALAKEMAKYDKESVKFEEKKKFLVGKQKKLEKAMQSTRLAASECDSLVQKHADDIERKSKETTQLEKEMKMEEEELNSIRESLKGKTQGLSDQITAKQKSLEPWDEKINKKLSAVAVAQSQLDIIRERSNAGAVLLEEAQAKVASIEEGLATKETELEERKEQKSTLEQEVEKLKHDLKKYAHREPEVRAHVSSARQKADEARASLASTQNRGSVLSGLMRLKESGRIEGFHGRLGNLGTIDEKYDVAISTACPALDNMVVDTVEVGQQCIDYLRKNNLGRANFILLDRLPRRDLSSIATPEKVPRLFDLVKPKDSKFAPAFYSVMQNTLVAKDLEQANRIAYGARRWRVVTLDGQLIDMSGTMSGGGTRVARGGMSSKQVAETSREQVAQLEGDLEEMERKFQRFLEKQRQMEAAIRERSEEIPRAETKIQKIMIEIESANRSLADAQRRVKELSAEHKPSKTDANQAAALEKQIAALEEEIEDLREQKGGIEEEIQTLQNKIMEVGGVRLRGQKAKVDGLKEQISLLAEEISNAEVGKSKNEKAIVKHQNSRADAEKELEHVTEELEKLNADVANQANDASGWKQKVEEAEEALDEKKEELGKVKAELDEKVAELNESRATEIEMRNKLEENQKALAENEKRGRYWQEKLSKLSLQNVSDLGEEQEATELQMFTQDELMEMNKESLKAAIAALEEKSQNASVDLSVIEEYRRRTAEHEARSADLTTALASRDSAKARLDGLRSARLNGFMEGFGIISLRLKEMYQMITMGGNAELELVDSLDPFSEGILFSVMPPKKSWKNIGNLSGGEKTLSSLALVFALHHYKPTPLYVMDEIDAALDFRNVSIVASYIKERTKNAQFIVISLRNNMFELASRLVGVYKVNHMTKSVTIENKDYITGR
ncbi:structural maintenance of chromosomes protein 4 [Aspergillus eucalypticola CBS 122712]|uniref:Structural maintenance of chromosomes protein n=1 Tax=Aspergillus eucalypticola (strain CBS 122712 / IBT 29274) TaxID=1448314 RepID=A0A317W3B9_ASPEC|nr:structural maintenance of chromosomes protein 4 [Aspergillus eucalypticola CBS 122712]PWY80071.1 structural maintenance of chromosomes protein 4 [Aspergillus eucalypticola CBS 122712]